MKQQSENDHNITIEIDVGENLRVIVLAVVGSVYVSAIIAAVAVGMVN